MPGIMKMLSTIKRNTVSKSYVKKWKNVVIDILVILLLPVPILLMTCTRKDEIPNEKKLSEQPCPQSAMLSSNPVDNRNKVGSYPLGDSYIYLSKLGLQDFDRVSSFLGDPVVITATSSNHFSYAVDLVERLKSNMKPKLKIVVYDIGMAEYQKQKICKDGGCEVRKFPFAEFPTFLEEKMQIIAWKPVLIQLALQKFGFVIWMDSAVYLPDGNLQAGIDIARTHGIAAGHKRVTYPDINLAFETDNTTFETLGEKPCTFQNSFKFNAALLFIRKSSIIYKYVMRPWVSCALTKRCIAADREPSSKCVNADKFGYCHRFDQSVLSVILNRLFHTKLTEIDLGNNVTWTKCYRRDSVGVFNEMVFTENKIDGIQCP
ncbi:uncharacterized protein LOC123536043 isoform X1 [Mercenaria mercenaria]|uniref:uncharacterized protein LOC123536043 isoform X1 n=1 Tax=Mercenaria mercenaria TaxID=6596 RepID=UPI001E1D7867|nr:uncharacterized protein LOC123536043 isoform X1 [Mercenaria mercenaria]